MCATRSSFWSRNTELFRQKIKEYLLYTKQWFFNTPERALFEAYEAAEAIKNIEQKEFGGNKISFESENYTPNVMSYWQGILDQNLITVKVKLSEFKLSRSILTNSSAVFLDKLKFIDEVVAKYSLQDELYESKAIIPIPQSIPQKLEIRQNSSPVNPTRVKPHQKTGILPRSIGRTFNRILADIAPGGEDKFVKNYRDTQNRTRISVKFLAMLVIIPLLTQIATKNFLVKPIVDRVRGENDTQIFINLEMEEEAYQELKTFEQELKFENFLKEAPQISAEVIEEKVKKKAVEIAKEFREKSHGAISNIFADMISLIAFAVVVATSKREIVVVKEFMDDIVYGLSDSAKAFLIILSTDIFVGFHSPHGWEVLLEGFSQHVGLAADRSWVNLFIATFPVILDTIIKYWIFRYLSRLSPSALATLKEMNE
jgi:CemA family